MVKAIISLICIAAGVVLVVKSEWFYDFFGPISWAEKFIHTEGGSRMAYKLIGILVIVLTFLFWAGILQSILLWIFAPTGRVLSR